MTGGGFGGCIIALVPESRAEPVAEEIYGVSLARASGRRSTSRPYRLAVRSACASTRSARTGLMPVAGGTKTSVEDFSNRQTSTVTETAAKTTATHQVWPPAKLRATGN